MNKFEKLNNPLFTKLKKNKIEDLQNIRGGAWTAKSYDTTTHCQTDWCTGSYSWADGSWTESVTTKTDYGKRCQLQTPVC